MFRRFTKRLVKVLARAKREATALESNSIGLDHILLGLIDDNGIARRVLLKCGVKRNLVRKKIIKFRDRKKMFKRIPIRVGFSPQVLRLLQNHREESKNVPPRSKIRTVSVFF
jgi:ATP-dependent Clp protease ATP-binding subunit ClpC